MEAVHVTDAHSAVEAEHGHQSNDGEDERTQVYQHVHHLQFLLLLGAETSVYKRPCNKSGMSEE